jgi:hypothetical protein
MWVRADTRGLFSKIDVSRKTASNTISDPSLPRWRTFVLRTAAYGPWWFPASTSSRRRGVGAVLLFGSGRRGALLRLVTDHADRTHFDQARRSMTIGHRRSHALTHRCFDPMAGVHFTQCSRKRLSACFNLFVPLVFSEIREIMRTFG